MNILGCILNLNKAHCLHCVNGHRRLIDVEPVFPVTVMEQWIMDDVSLQFIFSEMI